ncbi:MAG: cell division protein ZapA [Pseudomonadota bacterium]|jgi:cell division protein ZapA
MKQVEVQIMGQSYLLACPEDGESSLQRVVGRVDKAMCRIRDAGKVKARDRIAVLAALNLAFEEDAKPVAVAVPAPAPPPPAPLAPMITLPVSDFSSEHAAMLALASRIDLVLEHDGQLL